MTRTRISVRAGLLLIGERAGWTFAEQLGVALLAFTGSALTHVAPWAAAADAAGFAALISALGGAANLLMRIRVTGPFDVVDRTVRTFLASVLGTLAAAHLTSLVHTDWPHALAIAVPVTVIAAVKALAAYGAPGLLDASTIPVGAHRKAT